MRRYKRQMNLSEVKNAFHQSGYVDWHLNPRLSDSQQDDHDGEVIVQTAPPELKRPSLYAVVLLNDDYTPMEFVVEVLQKFFGMDLDKATQVMLSVHYSGKGVCGTFTAEIAETKVVQVNTYSRNNEHPLLCTMEKA